MRGSWVGLSVLGSATVLITLLQACQRLLMPSPTANREYTCSNRPRFCLGPLSAVQPLPQVAAPAPAVRMAQGGGSRLNQLTWLLEVPAVASLAQESASCRFQSKKRQAVPVRCADRLTFLGVLSGDLFAPLMTASTRESLRALCCKLLLATSSIICATALWRIPGLQDDVFTQL